MKVKLSKKLLCAVLSLLMVMTSLPLVVSAYDSAAASNLRDAIENYESTMDGTIYNSMSDAYNAYRNAVKTYDQYVYGMLNNGIEDSAAKSAADTLNQKTQAMVDSGVWVPGANIKEAWPTTEFESAYAEGDRHTFLADTVGLFNNILYTKPISATPTGSTTVDGVTVNVYHSDTVVYYSSKDAELPVVPVSVSVQGDSLYSIYPNQSASSKRDSAVVSLGYNASPSEDPWGFMGTWNDTVGPNSGRYNYWIGTKGSQYGPDFSHIMGQYGWWNTGDRRFAASSYSTGVRGSQNSANRLYSSDTDNKIEYAVNGIKVNSPLIGEFFKETSLSWYVGAGSVVNKIDGYITNDTAKIYVVNYDGLIKAAERNSQKLNIGTTDMFADGGLGNVIAAFESAMSLDISDSVYNYGSNISEVYKQAGLDVGARANALDTVEKTPDASEYQSLRDAIDNHRARYEENYNGGKVEDLSSLYTNWSDFVDVYEAALKAMDDATAADYPNDASSLEAIANAANALNSFVLLANTPRVDTILLEYAIDNAEYVLANKDWFILDSAQESNISAQVKKAKEDIWGSESNYPLDRYKPEDTDENFDKVLDRLTDVADSIRDIKVNLNAKVAYVGDKSLNQMLNEVEGYIADQAKYANSASLITARNNAQFFADDSNKLDMLSEPSRQNYARDLVNSYTNYVLAIYDAINSLVPSFTFDLDDSNGSVIRVGSNPSGITLSIKPNNRRHDFSFRPEYNNRVFLRTNTSASDFDLGEIFMSYNSGVDDTAYRNRNMLDSINVNLNKGTNWNGYSEDWTSITQSNHPGNLVAETTGAQFKVSNIRVLTGGNGDSNQSAGRHQNGEWVDGDKYNNYSVGYNHFDDDLAYTDGTQLNDYSKGGIYTFADNYTQIRADYTLHIDANNYNKSNVNGSTLPSIITYTVEKDIGFVGHYHDKTGGWFGTTKHGQVYVSTTYSESAQVIDITPLIALVQYANDVVAKQSAENGYYTTSSLNALNDALLAADSEFNYTLPLGDNNSTGETTWMGILRTRYTNLWNAIQGLQKRADFDVDTGIEVDGKVVSYDDAKYQVYIDLGKNYYTTESVNALVDYLYNGHLEYISLTPEGRMDIPASTHATQQIMKEIEELLRVVGERCVLADRNAYDAQIEDLRSLTTNNADAYNVSALQNLIDNLVFPQDSVMVNGYGVMTYSQTGIDNAVNDMMTAKTDNHYKYTITVYDANKTPYYVTKQNNVIGYSSDPAAASIFYYDDAVELKDPSGNNDDISWSGTVIASGTNQKQEPRYIVTASTYSFNVRGNTVLYTDAKNADAESKYIQIKFVSSKDSPCAIAYDYVEIPSSGNITYDLSKAPVPNRIFYSIGGFTDKATNIQYTNNDTITFAEGTTEAVIIVNYKAGDKAGGYIIDLLDENGNHVDGYPMTNVDWNQLVKVTIPGASALKDTKTNKILAYSDSFSFYACQSITIQQVSAAELATHTDPVDMSVISTPVLDQKRAQFVGSFAVNDSANCTVVGTGIVLDASGNHSASLTLSDVNSSKKILNLSAPLKSLMADNQFSVSIGYSSLGANFPVSYVGYVTYKDAQGNLHTAYSAVIQGTLV